jgi:hypothetical protein
MSYDPNNRNHRHELAVVLLNTLRTADFIEEAVEEQGVRERVFYRVLPNSGNRILIRVYTSIVGDEVRAEGKDAIRVCATYITKRDGKTRGIGSETRINRTGTIENINQRMLDRMRSVWKNTLPQHRTNCSCCGAPTFKSKAGNDVCAELCFKDREGYVEKPYQPRQSRPRPRPSYRRY